MAAGAAIRLYSVSRRCGRKSFGRTGEAIGDGLIRPFGHLLPKEKGLDGARKMDRGHPRNESEGKRGPV